jgi:hypothetical protein
LINTSFKSQLLVEELQLGEQLNQCVHTDRRADFSLMLSMLTDDVLAHSQFSLPETEAQLKETTDQTLRRYFELAEQAPLALENVDDIAKFEQAHLIEQEHFASLQLENSLNPKPLAFRNNAKHVASSVLSNTSLYCQQRYKQSKEQKSEDNRLAFNVNAWLKSVQTTLVKAPLIALEA